jgi:ubiquinone biosynthesis accessory factor UbiK
MLDIRAIDELAQRLASLVPAGFAAANEDLGRTFKATLQAGLARLDLVSREEFDVQRLVLQRTREKLEALEKQLAALEAAHVPPGARRG